MRYALKVKNAGSKNISGHPPSAQLFSQLVHLLNQVNLFSRNFFLFLSLQVCL